jgi:hypothetical protein
MSQIEELVAVLDGGDHLSPSSSWDMLRNRIMILNEWAWEGRAPWEVVSAWLDNFDGRSGFSVEQERLHALYILSQFLYFGSIEIRVLLKALYRDLVFVPLMQQARHRCNHTRELQEILRETYQALKHTRFLGVGTPSESGVHLLYYFRQENGLSKDHFLDSAQIFERVRQPGSSKKWQLRYPKVERYVFVDDVCGSGETAVRYSDFLEDVREENPQVEFCYYALFATADGMKRVRDKSIFGSKSGAVFELDHTYKCLSAGSRYLRVVPHDVDPDIIRKVATVYGEVLFPKHPVGYEGSELLLSFHHNTPDNTLPIIWMDLPNGSPVPWRPAFRRYPKV